MKNVYLSQLCIEITRKCNMNCIHCAKGEAQNLDISQDIVDKTISELKDTYINTFELIGGETFLNIEGFTATINKVIKNELKINKACFFTNGTIKDERIAKAIQKFADYLHENKPLIDNYIKDYNNKFSSINYYYDIADKDIVIIFSSTYHSNNSMGINSDELIEYYNSKINRDNCIALSQNENILSKEIRLNFEGNIVENYKTLPDNVIKNIRIVDRNYNIVDDSATDAILITKTLTISANGNVFIGNLSSYKKVDNELTMFNILDCKNDFYEKISNWCWLYPLNEKTHLTKERYNAFKWLKKENRLDNPELEKAYSKINIDAGIAYCEQQLKDLHRDHPRLTHNEIETAFNCWLLLILTDNTKAEKDLVLELFSSFNAQECKDILANYAIYKIRARKTLQKLYNK